MEVKKIRLSKKFVGGSEEGWRKEKDLDRGSFGIVSLWKSSSPQETSIALKVFCIPSKISRKPAEKEKLRNRCLDEVERMYKISCEYIVGAIEIPTELEELLQKEILFTSNHNNGDLLLQSPILGMEYCSGGDLKTLLEQPEHFSGLPEEEVLAVLRNISNAIQYLHSVPIGENRYIIHRDIKPANILIQWKGNKRVYKLSDLGLAKDIKDVSECSSYAGSRAYMAPEIFQGGKYDKTVDYWSFGLIAYEISCGTLPPKDRDNKYFLDIPARTHLSEFFRTRFNIWIPTMVTYEPKNRGNFPARAIDGREAIICSFAWLEDVLEGSYLQVYTCIKGRLVFRPINSDMTIAKVQEWIAHNVNTGISIENQLLLTSDGAKVSPDESAETMANANCKFYLVAKFGKQICSEIKIDKVLRSFLEPDHSRFNSNFDMRCMKELWRIAILYIQTQLEHTQNLLKIEKILKKRKNIRGCKGASVIQIEMISHEYCNGLPLKATSDLALIVLRQKLYDEFKLWRGSYKGSYTLKNVEDVRDTILSFRTKQQFVLTNLDHNIEVLLLPGVNKSYKDELWLPERKGFEHARFENGFEKQEIILNFENIPPFGSRAENSDCGFCRYFISAIIVFIIYKIFFS